MTVEELQRLLDVERVPVYRILGPLVARKVLTKSKTRPVVFQVMKDT
jgi:hypothetical protein